MQIKTTTRYHLTCVWMAIIRRNTNNKCWWRCREKGTSVHCWWECELVWPLWKTVWRFLKKFKKKIELLCEPAILLLNTHPTKKAKILIWKYTHIEMFMETLFTTDKIWKQPKCPSIDEWIKNIWIPKIKKPHQKMGRRSKQTIF